ncbi:MAG: nitrous oxide reductase family maturation protein NosD [Magnetospirillum sp.]|nr:nitrous oxide reductase family maturation protein NosD [Magnetospirillum sp.]
MARRRKAVSLVAVLVAELAAFSASGAVPSSQPDRDMAELQNAIAAAAPDAVIEPRPGRYVGHLVIDKAVTLDGHGQVTLDGGGQGTVVVMKTNGAAVMNMRITGTGDNHETEDAAVRILGNDNLVRDNVIDDALFGIDLKQADHNVVRRNRITSKPLELGLRGDSIRLWYSNDNKLEDNAIHDSRDFILWYSKRNLVKGNENAHGRYGLHFMFASDNVVEGNTFRDNSVGISMMYDQGDVIRGNFIGHAQGSTGTCISMKEASAIVIENNDIQYCASGIALDISPYQPGMVNRIEGNRIAFDDIGVSFINEWHDNEFRANEFKGNMTDVAVYGRGSAKNNLWDGNAWDSYEGFDRNNDGIGDTPFILMAYAGQMWMDVPNTRFFKGTPLLEVLDFLDRLAPFSQPEIILEDKHPRYRISDAGQRRAAQP